MDPDRVAKLRERVRELRKKITAGMSTSDIIHDFVHSSNSKFKHDSKKQRIRRALGAAYGR